MNLNERCPICHKMGFGELVTNPDGTYAVFCYDCGCSTDDHASADDAISQWNEGMMIDERI